MKPTSVRPASGRPAHDPPRVAAEQVSEFAHDLFEGLGTIALFVDALERDLGDLDASATRDLDGIRAGLDRMNALVTDKLWASSDRRRGDGHRAVDTNAVVREARANVEARVMQTGALIVCDPLPWVRGNAPDLTRLFQNLLANAIQHRNPDRVPRIRIAAHRQRSDWLFEVSDNGRGMADGLTFDSTIARPQPGDRRRLGLAICARIVAAHGGRIWTAPGSEGGTIVRFELPRAAE